MIVQVILAALLLLLLWFLLTDADSPAEEAGEASAVAASPAHVEPVLSEKTVSPLEQPRVESASDSVPPQTQPAGTP